METASDRTVTVALTSAHSCQTRMNRAGRDR
jgi:hypothetical protein